jgi:hypothetical protein
VARVGDCSLFQVAGVLGVREHFPATAAAGATAPAASPSNSRRRPALLGAGVRWFGDWRGFLLIVDPEAVLRWRRRGWWAYWRRRSRWAGRQAAAQSRQSYETSFGAWHQRTANGANGRSKRSWQGLVSQSLRGPLGKYMCRPWDREPSPGWRAFLKQHASAILACDVLCVRRVSFQTLYRLFRFVHAPVIEGSSSMADAGTLWVNGASRRVRGYGSNVLS